MNLLYIFSIGLLCHRNNIQPTEVIEKKTNKHGNPEMDDTTSKNESDITNRRDEETLTMD